MKRPLVRYHGGKFVLAEWIISHFPSHRVYCEPYGGGGNVLLKKQRSYAEIYNDLDNGIYTVFKVARDNPQELIRMIRRTPFSRKVFEWTYTDSASEVEFAAKQIIRSFQGFGSQAISSPKKYKTGFRANSNRSGTTPAHDWRAYARQLFALTKRLHGVVIENRDAVELMKSIDSPDVLFYVDPPYVFGTRHTANPKAYKHEMKNSEHEQLLTFLKSIKGFCILSGYRNSIYDQALDGWTRIDKTALKSSAKGGKLVTESLWLNERCSGENYGLFYLPQ